MSSLATKYAAIARAVLRVEHEEAARSKEEVDSKPRKPASAAAITRAEKKRGAPFHESYRAFLQSFDGWDHFQWGMSLFGTKELSGSAYDDAYEVFGYSDDPLPKELAEALLIGASEDDASRALLLRDGKVVSWRYEEEERYPDLGAFLENRKTVLLELRALANAAKKRTEEEWDAGFRKREDKNLEAELRKLLRAAPPAKKGSAPKAPLKKPKARAPADLVLRKGKEVVADVRLGLILYLGAAPTKDEVLATWRAFRRHFPVEGTLEWQLPSAMGFGTKEEKDAGSEPFAGALAIDDDGHFGLRACVTPKSRTARGDFLLNVRAIPPEQAEDDEGDDDDERDDKKAAQKDAVLVPRASFVEVMVPASEDPKRIEALCYELVDLLPVRSGQGGYFAMVLDDDVEPDPYGTVLAWCRRFFGVEVASSVDGWLPAARRRHRGAGWLTVLGPPFANALDARLRFSKSVARHDGKKGVVFRAGPAPTLGDVARGEFPVLVAEVARAIEPVTIDNYAAQGMLSLGGVYFSTSTDQLPGAFADHHATEAHLRRFVDPAGFIGPTPRERAEIFLEKLSKRTKKPWFKRWLAGKKKGDDGFGDVLLAIFNATADDTTSPLAIEALELATRYPDWAPPEAFNNLLVAYLETKDMAKAMALLPVALRTAKENPTTYHNAACAYVRAGKLGEALSCAKLAKAGGYDLEAMKDDEDLAPLLKSPEFRALLEDAAD